MSVHDDPNYRAGDAPDARPAAPRSIDDDFEGEATPSIEANIPFPPLMLITGALWIFAGLAYLGLLGLYRLIGLPFQANEIWTILAAALFIKDGIQLIRGTFRDPMWDGVLTIVIGGLLFAQGWYEFSTNHNIVALAIGILFGIIFLVPGILVLVGRKQYLAWRVQQGERLA